MKSITITLGVSLILSVTILIFPLSSRALPGSHGLSVSTWDTSVSTIVFAVNAGIFDGGQLVIAGYNANFSSTSGKLSAQFGLQYLNYREGEDPDVFIANGISGSAVALWGIPLMERHDNGLPKAALNLYLGAVPAALLSGEYNYLTIPIVVGIGMQFSPVRYISIVPWAEVAPSVNIDTVIKPFTITAEDVSHWIDPETSEVSLTQEQVLAVVEQSVDMEYSFTARLRGGLSLAFHFGDKVDLQLNAIVSHIGNSFEGPVIYFVGGGLVIAWDDPPPAVLPAKTRLEREGCPAVWQRFKQCPAFPRLVHRVKRSVKCTENDAKIAKKKKRKSSSNEGPPAPKKSAPKTSHATR